MEIDNEKLIRRFFFGEMSAAERFDLEERFISDTDLFEEIRVFEDGLIERYVRGWMDPAERSTIEKHFLNTDTRRERVEFSRELVSKLDDHRVLTGKVKEANSVIESGNSIRDRLAAILFTPRLAMGGAMALVLVVIGVWFVYHNSAPQSPEIVRSNVNREPHPSPKVSTPEQIDRTIDAENAAPANDPGRSLEPVTTDAVTTPKRRPAKSRTKLSAPDPVLALFPGTLRSEGKNSVLKMPKGARAARLQLDLDGSTFKLFQVALTDQDGNVLFTQSNLISKRSKVNFTIPAEKLQSGDYIVKLNGKNPTGGTESVADFQFRVQ